MSQSMSDWPVGFPAVAVGSYAAANATGIHITKGDQFKVIGVMNAPGTQIQLARIEYSNPTRRGWVRRDTIWIGTRARVGEPVAVVRQTAPAINLIGVTPSLHNPAGVVWRTVSTLIDAFYENRESVYGYNRSLDDIRKRPGEAANQIFQGFRQIRRTQGGTQLDTLSDPRFTVNDLANIPEISRSNLTEWWIIYIIIYYFANNRQPEIYDGKSIKPGQRKKDHIYTTESTTRAQNSIHYGAARQATSFKMVPVCSLPTNSRWLSLAEQVVQSMLQTTAHVYTSNAPFTMPTAAAHDLQTSAGVFALDQMAGSTLKHISDQVFASPSILWPGGTARTSFGSTVGLNAKSALTESNSWAKTSWTISYAEGIGHTLRRAGRRLTPRRTVFRMGAIMLKLSLRQIELIGPRTEIHVVFELKDNDAEHEYCYARLPDLFGTNDVAKANSWGVRVEWSKDGVWKALYLQKQQLKTRKKDRTIRGATSSYRVGILIYHFLKNQIINPGPDLPFLQNETLTSMQGVVSTFDHLEQVVQIKDLGEPCNVPAHEGPRLLTTAEVEANIRAKIDPAWRTSIRVPLRDNPTANCDSCRLNHKTNCGTKDGHCPNCTALNLICTFSDFGAYSQNSLALALTWKPVNTKQIFDIPDPAVQVVSMDEEGDIGDEENEESEEGEEGEEGEEDEVEE